MVNPNVTASQCERSRAAVSAVISLDTHRMPGRQTLRAHAHDEVMLMIVSDGALDESIDGRVQTMNAGAVRLSPAGAAHDLYFGDEGAVCTLIEGRGPFWRRVLSRPLRRHSTFTCIGTGDAAALAADDGRSLIASAKLSLLCRALTALHGVDPDAAPSWLADAQDALACADDRRVASVSAAVGRNRTHFARAFTVHVGLTPQEFRALYRLSAALAALSEDAPLAEIALACGYAHQSHMNNAFRALYGRTPGGLRAERAQQSCNTSR